ncbi:MAG: ion channel [Nitrososphaeraceae archaeon]
MFDKEKIISLLVVISVILVFIQSSYSLTGIVLIILYIFDLSVISILAIDFYKRVNNSSNPKKYFISHIYEIPAMIPLLLFGILETNTVLQVWLRGLRLIRLFRVLSLVARTGNWIGKTNSRLFYVAVFSITSLTLGAFSIYFVEYDIPDSKITNIGDAFWWALVTVTTVGYGDVYPITTEGRIIASILMVVGIAVIGLLISTLGAGLIESRVIESRIRKTKGKNDEIKSTIKKKVDNIEMLQKDELSSLVNLINELHINSKNKGKNDNSICNNCQNINPKKAKFCNMCGISMK